MSREQELSDLIGAIYDCAIDPALWSSTLAQIAAFLDSPVVSIDVACPIPGHPELVSHLKHGFPAGAVEEYFEKYSVGNPLVYAGMLYDAGEVATTREMLGDNVLKRYPSYRDWAVPLGMIEMISGIIRKDSVRLAVISASRRDRYDEADKVKLRLLVPHLRRSVTIAQLIDERTIERDRFREIVERLAAAVFLVDSTGFIHHVNEAGRHMLEDGGVLRARNGRIACTLASVQAELLAAIEAGERGAHAVPLVASDGRPLVASILPLVNGYRREASGAIVATAAVFVDSPAARFEWPGEMVGKLFKLTGAELQVLLALLDGATLQGAAGRFGVSLATVKTHLQRIFAKTGTSRQADLMRKVAKLMPQVRR